MFFCRSSKCREASDPRVLGLLGWQLISASTAAVPESRRTIRIVEAGSRYKYVSRPFKSTTNRTFIGCTGLSTKYETGWDEYSPIF